MLCYTENGNMTQTVLKLSPQIHPGCKVWVVNARVQPFVKKNVIITLQESLVPFLNQQIPDAKLQPLKTKTKTPILGFDFASKSEYLRSLVPVDGVCAGSFCDSRSEANPVMLHSQQ